MYTSQSSSTPRAQAWGSQGLGSSMEGWNSLSVKRTASFSAIQEETLRDVSCAPGETCSPYDSSQPSYIQSRYNSREEEKPGGESTGQLNPNSPIGDMLLPLLAMALVYAIVKLFRKRSTTQAL